MQKIPFQSERFVEWAKRQLSDAQDHNLRASLQWLLGDRQAAAESLAKVAQRRDIDFDRWKERFRAAGNEHLRELLKALIAANPKDAQSQLELMALDGVVEGPELIQRQRSPFAAIERLRDLLRNGEGTAQECEDRQEYCPVPRKL